MVIKNLKSNSDYLYSITKKDRNVKPLFYLFQKDEEEVFLLTAGRTIRPLCIQYSKCYIICQLLFLRRRIAFSKHCLLILLFTFPLLLLRVFVKDHSFVVYIVQQNKTLFATSAYKLSAFDNINGYQCAHTRARTDI